MRHLFWNGGPEGVTKITANLALSASLVRAHYTPGGTWIRALVTALYTPYTCQSRALQLISDWLPLIHRLSPISWHQRHTHAMHSLITTWVSFSSGAAWRVRRIMYVHIQVHCSVWHSIINPSSFLLDNLIYPKKNPSRRRGNFSLTIVTGYTAYL